MAVIHRAYTFDPSHLHSMLEQQFVDSGRLYEDRLLMAARDAVAVASATTRQALEMVRFDEEWFDYSEEGVPRVREWCIILLASMLSSAPSLTHRFPVGWIVLERVLPLAGWAKEDVQQLVHGQSLRTLFSPALGTEFAAQLRGVDQFGGGWLDVNDAVALRRRLDIVADFFTPTNDSAIEAATVIAALWSRDAREVLQSVYADACEMLESSAARQRALFLVLD
jgi:hypothetical protein